PGHQIARGCAHVLLLAVGLVHCRPLAANIRPGASGWRLWSRCRVLMQKERNCGDQKIIFTASWMTRGSPAVVIVPKFAAPSTALGLPSGGVLRRLKASARSSSAVPVVTGTRRESTRSTLR